MKNRVTILLGLVVLAGMFMALTVHAGGGCMSVFGGCDGGEQFVTFTTAKVKYDDPYDLAVGRSVHVSHYKSKDIYPRQTDRDLSVGESIELESGTLILSVDGTELVRTDMGDVEIREGKSFHFYWVIINDEEVLAIVAKQ